MASSTTAMLKVTLGAADISQQVIRVDVEDVDRGADKATFVMDDPGSTSSDGVQEGMPVRIELGWETEHALAFVGRVRSVRSVADSNGRHRLVATCMDMSIRLMEPPPPEGRQYLGTLKEILAAIASRAEIELGAVTIDPMPSWPRPGRESLNQMGRTDWQMIQDLAEEHRARAFIEVNAQPSDSEAVRAAGGTPKLYFASEQSLLDQEPIGSLTYCRGMGSLLDVRVERIGSGASPLTTAAVASADDPAVVDSLDTPPPPAEGQPGPSASRTERAVEVLGPARAGDHAAAMQNAADSEVQPADQRARRALTGHPSSSALVQRLIQQDRTRILGYQLTGTAMGTVFLRAKGSVTIEGIPSVTTGRWYVSRVNHILERARIDDERARAADRTRLTYRTRLVATR